VDFAGFEQLALQVLFETRDPLTAPHLAYLAGISVERAERFLARMVEQGTVVPRLGPKDGLIEYGFVGRRGIESQRRIAQRLSSMAPPTGQPGQAGEAPAQPNSATGEEEDDLYPAANSATAVLLSVLVPGAGHIYSGRSGAGVAWMATTLAGYACCLLPGLFLHGLCLVSAAHARDGSS
jgi:hypothetical protein